MVNVGQAVGYLELDTSGFKRGFKSAMSDLDVFKDATATTNEKLSGLSSTMTSVGSSLTKGLTLPIAGAGAAIIKTTASFEAGMSQVAAISGATNEDLEALSDKAKEMGAITKFSASESAEALKYMAMAGWDTQKMLDGLPGVMNLAAASGEDLGSVSDIVTDALTAFGMKAEEAAHFSDVLAKASSRSNTNVGLMGETFKYVAPLAGSLGYSAEDVAVAIGLMANAGIKGSRAGTSLRAAITRMVKPTSDAAKIMGELGIEITNTDGTMKDFKEVMDILRSSIGGLSEAQQAQAASTIFGQESMSGMLAIINASTSDYENLVAEINNADGAAQTMADTMIDNLPGALTILSSTAEGIALQFGEIMLPAVQAFVRGLQQFATWLNDTSEESKKIIVVIATVSAALGPLLLIGGKLISGFLTIKALLAATGTTLAALTSPIGILIAAVAAFALAWTTNFGGIRDTVKNVMSIVLTTISTVLKFIKKIWDSNWLGIQNTVKSALNAIEIVIETALGVIEGLIQVFSGIITLSWTDIWEGLKKIVSSIWNGIKNLFKTFLNWIVDTLISIGAQLYVAAQTVFQYLKNGFTEKWSEIKAWFAKVKDDPIAAIKSIFTKLYNIGKNAINKLWQGFKDAWKSVKSWFEGIGEWISSKLQFWKTSVSNAGKTASSTPSTGAGRRTVDVKGYAKGLDYVPYDGFPAILHKGEKVLTAKEANAYDSGTSGSGQYTFNFYNPQALSPAEQSRQFKKTMDQILFDM